MSDDVRPCPCGSGLPSRWVKDGHGIPLTRTCQACHDRKMKEFRPDIMEKYEADEPIDPE